MIDLSLIRKSEIVRMLKYSWPMVPNSLSQWIVSMSDRVVILVFMGIEANAVYAVATKFPQIFSTIQSTFTLAWQESASLAVDDKDNAEYYSKTFDSVFCILFGAMALLIAFSPIIFPVLIRGNYDEAYYQMPILYIGAVFSSISSYMGGIYVAHMKTKSIGISTFLAAVCNLLINFALIRSIGLYAASFSTLFSYMFLSIYRMVYVRKFQAIRYNIPKIVILLGLLIFMGILCYQRVFVFDIINILLAVAAAIIANKVVLTFVFRSMFKKIKRRVKNENN
jgi:O-antigen/teichoic acid export membrane protein